MSVTNLSINKCRYSIQKLDNYVWLLPKESIGIINDEYYVESSAKALQIKCYSVSLTSQESLDERYKFTHTLNFNVLGYKNHKDFGERYYAMVRDMDGNYWLVNPDFKLKFSYTFTVDTANMHTDFTLTSDSNMPVMSIRKAAPWADANYTSGSTMYKWHEITPAYSEDTFICDVEEEWECKDYNHCKITELAINETRYTSFSDETEAALYSNDGFKTVDFIKNSATLTEQFDGEKIVHTVKFKIQFTDNTTWQNQLLEFANNKYCVIVYTSCGHKIATGFHYGLHPTYAINATAKEGNYVEITLQDLHDEGSFIAISTNISLSGDTRVIWKWVTSEFECLTNNTANHLLQQSFDCYGNKTYTYKCLEGYEDYYSEIYGDKLIGTFESGSSVVFHSGCNCFGTECEITTDIDDMTFTRSGQTKYFKVFCNKSQWEIATTAPDTDITISPMSGYGNVEYTVAVTCNKVPTDIPTVNKLMLWHCDGDGNEYDITIEKVPIYEYFPQGDTYNVSSDQQTLRINTTLCIKSVVPSSEMVEDINIQPSYISMTVLNNGNCGRRSTTLLVTSCEGEEFILTINQDGLGCTDELFTAYYSNGATYTMTCTSDKIITSYMINGAPEDASLMTAITIGDCCASIASFAFSNCVNLTNVTIGNGLMAVGNHAFDNTALSSLTISAELPPRLENNFPLSIAVINVPCQSVALYKSASIWRFYSNIIQTNCPSDYRTISGTPYCNGFDRYVDVYSQVSYDSGATWETTATTPTLLERNSETCGYIPPSPTIDYTREYMTFLTKEPCTFTFQSTSAFYSLDTNFAQYSLDSGSTWHTLSSSAETTPVIQANQRVMWKCDATPNSSLLGGGIGVFLTTGRFELEGNIMSMLWGDDFIGKTDLKGSYVFFGLFDSTSVTNAENLIMPATTLTEWCYASMFPRCALLEKAPVLSATTSVNRCYLGMFANCSSLKYVKCLMTDMSAPDATYGWLQGVAPNGTFVKAASANWGTCGSDTIPCSWTVQDA